MARNPSRWRARISGSKPVASAQAPWTRTIVGLFSSGWVAMSAPLKRCVSSDRREQYLPYAQRPQARGQGGRLDGRGRDQRGGIGNKPSWYLVSTDDRMIPPAAQREISGIAIGSGS